MKASTLCKYFMAASLLIGLPFCSTEHATASEMAELIDSAQTGSAEARYHAIDDLGERAQSVGPIIDALAAMLADDDVQIQWRVARSLGDFGSLANSAVPALVELLETGEPIVKMHCAVALGRIGDESEATVMSLIKLVTHDDARIARVAVAALRSIKPDPTLTVKTLAEALRSDDHAVTSHAIDAMVEAGPRAVPLLKEALLQPDTAYLACVTIGEIGPEAADAVPELTMLLRKTSHSKLITEAILALGRVGPAANSAKSVLKDFLTFENDDTIPVAAAFALGAIGATDSISQLQNASQQGDKPFLRMVATWSLAKLNPEDTAILAQAKQLLSQGLTSNDELVQTAASKLLADLEAPQ